MDAVKNRWIPGAAVGAAVLSACAGAVWGNHVARTGSVALDLPAPRAAADTAACRALIAELPGTLEGRERRRVVPATPAHSDVPDSQRAAVWGSPTTVLRCGVAEPGELVVGGPDYDPLNNQLITINGVNWLVQDQQDDSVRFTTTDRAAYVEVYVPGDTRHATDVLVDLAPGIIATVPARDGSGLVPDKS